jgi:ferredoxin
MVALVLAGSALAACGSSEAGMRVVVDFDLCESNAVCMGIAPPRCSRCATTTSSTCSRRSPGEDLREKVEEAVQRCPKQAISAEG